MLKAFLNDEAGAIISIELVLVVTIAVLALIVGLSEVAVAVNTELNDISNAVGALNQDYSFTGFKAGVGVAGAKAKSQYFGTTYNDTADDCDVNDSCEIVCSTASNPATNEQ